MTDKQISIKEERSKHVENLLGSRSLKKVVVAGPGTGKTYLFSKILKDKKNTLTLTFVNSLVEDLSLELCGLSDVRTLHSYARSILSRSSGKNLKIFGKLSSIIREDTQHILDQDINFDWIFNQRDESKKELIEFYKQRRKYYNYYGFTDIVYTAVLYFEMGNERIPEYTQIVVDEFQDFNRLEVDLIDLLARRSPILLAGDDDQALYQFKGSSNQFIRDRYSQTIPGYEPFNLPFCARCPRVIVDAANDLINSARKLGHLNGRIDKPFVYFDDPDKDITSSKYPHIFYTQVFPSQIPWFIEKKIAEMANEVKGKFSVLIISPYKKQTIQICKSLRSKGLHNLDYEEKDSESVTIFDGYKILMEDKHDNLGWRIISGFLIHPIQFREIIRKSHESLAKPFEAFLPVEIIKKVKSNLSILNYINKNRDVNTSILEDLLKDVEIDQYVLLTSYIKTVLNSNKAPTGYPEIRKIPVKATTIQSAKGLAADLVFITHFDNQYFLQNRDNITITDQDICNLLVSITRAKQKLFLISSNHERPTFLDWISKEKISSI
jgi:superfamily I DNA/RNA helicase